MNNLRNFSSKAQRVINRYYSAGSGFKNDIDNGMTPYLIMIGSLLNKHDARDPKFIVYDPFDKIFNLDNFNKNFDDLIDNGLEDCEWYYKFDYERGEFFIATAHEELSIRDSGCSMLYRLESDELDNILDSKISKCEYATRSINELKKLMIESCKSFKLEAQ